MYDIYKLLNYGGQKEEKMKLFKRMKTILAMAFIAVLGIAATVSGVSTPLPPGGVPIQSEIAVMNVTSGDNLYHDTVNANVDEVVKAEVWYHNPEDDDSGRIAQNVNVRINIPTNRSTTHTITSTVGGTNTNTVTDVTTVNTSLDAALAYIPGTAYRRYNAGTNEQPNIVTVRIPDSVISTGYVIPAVNPCWNFQETITVQARVMRPTISIIKQVRVTGTETWHTANTAEPGDSVDYKITFRNEGNTQLNNVVIRDNMPPYVTYIPGTTRVYTPTRTDGYSVADGVTGAGVNIGNYAVGSAAVVRFSAQLPETVGSNDDATFRNVAVVRADGLGEYYNQASTTVTYRPASVTQIRIVKFNDANANRVQDGSEARLAGWVFRVSGPNGYTNTVTTGADGTNTITGLRDGRYTVTEVLQPGWANTTGISVSQDVTVDPSTQTFRFGNRRTIPTNEPGGEVTELPTSGPVETAAAAFGTMSFSGVAVAWARSKKKLLSAFRK
jgi:uncharacterized repeat protein (TIGR01451 family)